MVPENGSKTRFNLAKKFLIFGIPILVNDGKCTPLANIKIFRFEEKGLVQGEFVHVFVDPRTEKPVLIPESWRANLKILTHPA